MIWHKKYPLSKNHKTKVFITLGFGTFVALFLAIFQPFELSAPGLEYRYLKIGGYGIITMLVLANYHYVVLPLFDDQSWTVGREITAIFTLIMVIGTFNYLYTAYIFHWSSTIIFGGLLQFVAYTFAVGAFPVTILTLLKQNQLQRRHLDEAQQINVAIHHDSPPASNPQVINLEGDYNNNLNLDPNHILFIESIGNYIAVHYLEQGKILKKELRSTLTKAQKQLLPYDQFFKTHRAYIVNLQYIKHVSGNAQGLRLTLSEELKEVPVARSKIKEFRASALND